MLLEPLVDAMVACKLEAISIHISDVLEVQRAVDTVVISYLNSAVPYCHDLSGCVTFPVTLISTGVSTQGAPER